MELAALLAALHGTDEEAYCLVWRRAFHGERLTSETAPIVRYLLTAVHDPGFGAGDESKRTGMLFLLREVARVDARFDLLPEVFAALWPIPTGWPRRARVAAASAAAMLVRHPALGDRRDEVIAHHEAAALDTEDRLMCASYMVGLGELGVAPRAWLDDPRLGVRTCAALAPALAADETALSVLVRAAGHPRAFDHAFEEPFVAPRYRMMFLSQFAGRSRDQLIATVCERVTDFRRLLNAAVAAVELRDASFGPYLRVAFPSGLADDGTASAEQDCFVRALTARDDVWEPSRRGVFAAAGLPHDRDRWREVHVPKVLDDRGRPIYASGTIVVLDATRQLRRAPRMYLGRERSDPRLLGTLLDVIRRDGLRVDVEGPLRFTVTGGPDDPRPDPEDLVTGPMPWQPRLRGVRVAAAFSLWVTAHQWVGGIAYRQQFVDGTPMAPCETLGPADHEDGFHIVFELDQEWLPAGARLPG
ncbi:hypothetical protein [Dactylosporangium sp. NPDC050588]|uniref:hypothetical protein n=1 Tax=Dactylosporangium sp. NPDC050588 TaxID=3157211 RepID=UPI0033F0CB83